MLPRAVVEAGHQDSMDASDGPLRLVSIAEAIRSSSILSDRLAKPVVFTATRTGEFGINLRELVIAVFAVLK